MFQCTGGFTGAIRLSCCGSQLENDNGLPAHLHSTMSLSTRRYQELLEDDANIEEEEAVVLALLSLLLVVGAQEAQRLRSSRRQRLYLCRPELLPHPRFDTPWQILHHSRNDRAYITTMGVNVSTFDYVLEQGFADIWDALPIPRSDSNPNGRPRSSGRSLDAAGALGLFLHWVNSTMTETSLQQIFALTPSTLNRYRHFAQRIILFILRQIPEGVITFPSAIAEFEALSHVIQVSKYLISLFY